VAGCDPSPHSDIAAEKYRINVAKEMFRPDLFSRKFDCVVMRHVLEHVLDPISFLRSVRSVMADNGLMAVEVPDGVHLLRNGMAWAFYHEHLSYFSVPSLREVVRSAGFTVFRTRSGDGVIYLLARRTHRPVGEREVPRALDCSRHVGVFTRRVSELRREWGELAARLVADGSDIYLYGAGTHTTFLLHTTRLPAKMIVDSNRALGGMRLAIAPETDIGSPENLRRLGRNAVVVVSTFSFQDEIVKNLRKIITESMRIVTLYPRWRFVKTKEGRPWSV